MSLKLILIELTLLITSAALALLLTFPTSAAAQGVPRPSKNITRAERAEWRKVLRWPGVRLKG